MSRHLLLLRHAEKALPGADEVGVDARGRVTPAGLSVRGWQRAGGLVRLLATPPATDPRLARPVAVFAAADRPDSARPRLTVEPLAAALRVPVVSDFRSGRDEARLLEQALQVDGPVLVCWRHDALPWFARTLSGEGAALRWDDACYDTVWVFRREGDGRWSRETVPQRLLAGDA